MIIIFYRQEAIAANSRLARESCAMKNKNSGQNDCLPFDPSDIIIQYFYILRRFGCVFWRICYLLSFCHLLECSR